MNKKELAEAIESLTWAQIQYASTEQNEDADARAKYESFTALRERREELLEILESNE